MRVIAGVEPAIESGTIIVRGGKIASVSSAGANTRGLRVIDGRGMTPMPGFIDGHKHVNPAPTRKGRCSRSSKPATRPCSLAAAWRKTISRFVIISSRA